MGRLGSAHRGSAVHAGARQHMCRLGGMCRLRGTGGLGMAQRCRTRQGSVVRWTQLGQRDLKAQSEVGEGDLEGGREK